MAKVKTSYICTSCSQVSVKWLGCCPQCQEWNTFAEQQPARSESTLFNSNNIPVAPLHTFDQVPRTSAHRLVTGIPEWDRVVGGGIMPGALMILTGDPGIGKSTLLLQIASKLSQNHSVFYCSTEESLQQVMSRAERLDCKGSHLKFSDTAELASLIAAAEHELPAVMIIDSIQNCYLSGSHATPGSMSQMRAATFALMRLAKEKNISVIMTGHITKEGLIAGPKTVEHMVDVVLYLQGEERYNTRVLRTVKNRFGTINELGFFEMQEQGLTQVPDINKFVIEQASHAPGATLVSIMEGSRPLLVELQALTIDSKLSIPQRVISGVDHKQVMLVAALLEKYLRIPLSKQDIFFKVSGGFKIKGSAIDLGIACALLSSYLQQTMPLQSLVLGELSLTGAIRPVNYIQQFTREANKFGLAQVVVSSAQQIEKQSNIIHRCAHLYELLSLYPNEQKTI